MPNAPGTPGIPLPPPLPSPRAHHRSQPDSDRPSQSNIDGAAAFERARGAERFAELVWEELKGIRADFAAVNAKVVALDTDVQSMKSAKAEKHGLRLARIGVLSAMGAALVGGAFVLVSNLLTTARTEAKSEASSVASAKTMTNDARMAEIADKRINEALLKRDQQGAQADTIVANSK